MHRLSPAKYYARLAKTSEDGVTALNTMLAQDGLLVYVPKNVKVERAVQVINILKSPSNLSPLTSHHSPLTTKEIELIQKMSEFGAAVEQAGKDYSPSGIANYCYELTKVFNQFYHDYSILNEPDEQKKAVRLVLAKNVAKIIKSAMALLGIEVPERM